LSHISFTIITEPDWVVSIIQLYKFIIRKKINKRMKIIMQTACFKGCIDIRENLVLT